MIVQINSVLAVIKLANDRSDGGRAAPGKRRSKNNTNVRLLNLLSVPTISGKQSPIPNLQTVRMNNQQIDLAVSNPENQRRDLI
jgi:hypothetical protein